jgi:hypothetical protein
VLAWVSPTSASTWLRLEDEGQTHCPSSSHVSASMRWSGLANAQCPPSSLRAGEVGLQAHKLQLALPCASSSLQAPNEDSSELAYVSGSLITPLATFMRMLVSPGNVPACLVALRYMLRPHLTMHRLRELWGDVKSTADASRDTALRFHSAFGHRPERKSIHSYGICGGLSMSL